jgi:hypothetical protein
MQAELEKERAKAAELRRHAEELVAAVAELKDGETTAERLAEKRERDVAELRLTITALQRRLAASTEEADGLCAAVKQLSAHCAKCTKRARGDARFEGGGGGGGEGALAGEPSGADALRKAERLVAAAQRRSRLAAAGELPASAVTGQENNHGDDGAGTADDLSGAPSTDCDAAESGEQPDRPATHGRDRMQELNAAFAAATDSRFRESLRPSNADAYAAAFAPSASAASSDGEAGEEGGSSSVGEEQENAPQQPAHQPRTRSHSDAQAANANASAQRATRVATRGRAAGATKALGPARAGTCKAQRKKVAPKKGSGKVQMPLTMSAHASCSCARVW